MLHHLPMNIFWLGRWCNLHWIDNVIFHSKHNVINIWLQRKFNFIFNWKDNVIFSLNSLQSHKLDFFVSNLIHTFEFVSAWNCLKGLWYHKLDFSFSNLIFAFELVSAQNGFRGLWWETSRAFASKLILWLLMRNKSQRLVNSQRQNEGRWCNLWLER